MQQPAEVMPRSAKAAPEARASAPGREPSSARRSDAYIRALKAGPVPLAPGMSAASAFQAVAHACLSHLLVNEALFLAGRHPEALHQSRVALRRLRSALSIFGEVVADDELPALKERLRAFLRPLGPARDLDVYRGRLLAADGSGRDGAGPDLAAVEEERERAYERVLRAFRSAAYKRLVADLVGWIEAGPWLQADDPGRVPRREKPVEAFAAEALAKRQRAVIRKGRHLAQLDPAARHRVRILAKKLRYAAEFFGPLAADRKARARHKAFLAALEGLQEELGALNDLATGQTLAARLAPESAGTEAPPEIRDAPDPEQESALLEAAARDYRAVAEAKPFLA